VAENRNRNHFDFEHEELDTGIFLENRYFDVLVEYAKAEEDDLPGRITVANRGPDASPCYVLPTLWFRNTWSWGYEKGPMGDVPGKPILKQADAPPGASAIRADHPAASIYYLYAEGTPELLFAENETNTLRLYGSPAVTSYFKDAFHRYVVEERTDAVNPAHEGAKAAAHSAAVLPPVESHVMRLIKLFPRNGDGSRPIHGSHISSKPIRIGGT
jgi:hypothetical protein